jgi:hypothetical protein
MGWLVGPFVLVALATPSSAFAQTPVQGSVRVRGSSPVIAAAIEQAYQQSPTFNQLVTAIAATNRIVYVHYGECGRNVLACLVLAVTQAGPYRILQMRVDPRRKGTQPDGLDWSRAEARARVVERTDGSQPQHGAHFYQRIAPRRGSSFETQAAVEIGLKIDGELRRSAK